MKYENVKKKGVKKNKKAYKNKNKYEPSGPKLAYSGIQQPGIFLLPPGWDASPSQGYPRH